MLTVRFSKNDVSTAKTEVVRLTERRLALEASKRLLQDDRQALESKLGDLKAQAEEVALPQSLFLPTLGCFQPLKLPVEIRGRILSFLPAWDEPSYVEPRLYDLPARRYRIDVQLRSDGPTPKLINRLRFLKSKGVVKFNVEAGATGATEGWYHHWLSLMNYYTPSLAIEGLQVGLENFKNVLSIPDYIGRVACTVRGPGQVILLLWEALGPYLCKMEEMRMDQQYDIYEEEGLANKIEAIIATALGRGCNFSNSIKLRRATTEYTLLPALAKAGLLRSCTQLQVTPHYWGRNRSPNILMEGISGLNSLQVLDLADAILDLDAHDAYPAAIYLPHLRSLAIREPAHLRLFSPSTLLSCLFVKDGFSEETDAAITLIAEKLPSLSELITVSLRTLVISVLWWETTDTVYLFRH